MHKNFRPLHPTNSDEVCNNHSLEETNLPGSPLSFFLILHNERTKQKLPSSPERDQDHDINQYLLRSSPPPELAWATVVAKGLKKKAVTPRCSFCSRSDQIMPVTEILHDPDLATQTVLRKTASIIQQALTPSAVVFSFPEDLFSSRKAAYHAIQVQIGVLKGIKCLNMYSAFPKVFAVF